MNENLPRYDRSRTYRWNYDHAPEPRKIAVPECEGQWTFAGRRIASPLGVAAGPLLNGRWVLYYASLGLDVLTYKTVRSTQRDCYPLPNLQPVSVGPMIGGETALSSASDMEGTWAISFGMPSMSPDVWRTDVQWTRRQLPAEKVLSVSVVGSPQPGWTIDDLADDYARCARWSIDSGADCIEANFSCPNVSTQDGQLYQQAGTASLVAQRIRDAVGDAPLFLKIGHVTERQRADALLTAVAAHVDGLVMTNCIPATVRGSDGEFLFESQPRGIGGEVIRAASIRQVRLFADLVRQRKLACELVGVGGISTSSHVRDYLRAGADSVQLATAAMTNPLVACEIRRSLGRSADAIAAAAAQQQ